MILIVNDLRHCIYTNKAGGKSEQNMINARNSQHFITNFLIILIQIQCYWCYPDKYKISVPVNNSDKSVAIIIGDYTKSGAVIDDDMCESVREKWGYTRPISDRFIKRWDQEGSRYILLVKSWIPDDEDNPAEIERYDWALLQIDNDHESTIKAFGESDCSDFFIEPKQKLIITDSKDNIDYLLTLPMDIITKIQQNKELQAKNAQFHEFTVHQKHELQNSLSLSAEKHEEDDNGLPDKYFIHCFWKNRLNQPDLCADLFQDVYYRNDDIQILQPRLDDLARRWEYAALTADGITVYESSEDNVILYVVSWTHEGTWKYQWALYRAGLMDGDKVWDVSGQQDSHESMPRFNGEVADLIVTNNVDDLSSALKLFQATHGALAQQIRKNELELTRDTYPYYGRRYRIHCVAMNASTEAECNKLNGEYHGIEAELQPHAIDRLGREWKYDNLPLPVIYILQNLKIYQHNVHDNIHLVLVHWPSPNRQYGFAVMIGTEWRVGPSDSSDVMLFDNSEISLVISNGDVLNIGFNQLIEASKRYKNQISECKTKLSASEQRLKKTELELTRDISTYPHYPGRYRIHCVAKHESTKDECNQLNGIYDRVQVMPIQPGDIRRLGEQWKANGLTERNLYFYKNQKREIYLILANWALPTIKYGVAIIYPEWRVGFSDSSDVMLFDNSVISLVISNDLILNNGFKNLLEASTGTAKGDKKGTSGNPTYSKQSMVKDISLIILALLLVIIISVIAIKKWCRFESENEDEIIAKANAEIPNMTNLTESNIDPKVHNLRPLDQWKSIKMTHDEDAKGESISFPPQNNRNANSIASTFG